MIAVINRYLHFQIGELKTGGTVVEGTAGKNIYFRDLRTLSYAYANYY
jgi:hypothetical protein